jgi:hypothetical protein
MTFDEARDLAIAADKYQIRPLLEICVEEICNLQSLENWILILETAIVLENETLKHSSLKVYYILLLHTIHFYIFRI